jgi:SAM-dependent methyltransferase
MKDWLYEVLVCPECGGQLVNRSDALHCDGCTEAYPVVRGIPVFTSQADVDEDVRASDSAEPRVIPAVERAVCEHQAEMNVDVGCGTGRNLGLFSGRVVACDIDFTSLVAAARRDDEVDADVGVVCCAAESLPFRDGEFGFGLSSEVFEHIQPEKRGSYVNELNRIVAWNGRIVVSAPIETGGGEIVSGAARWLGLLDNIEGDDDHPRLTPDTIERYGFSIQGCLDAPAVTALEQRKLGCLVSIYENVIKNIPGLSTHAVGVKQAGSE